MRSKFCSLALTGFLTVGLAGATVFAQDQTAEPSTQTTESTTQNQNMESSHHMRMHGHHRMNSERQLKRMTKELALTTDQQTQIKPILESRDQQMRQLWQDKTMAKADRQQKMMDIHQDTSSKIEAVLNDTQKQKYEAMQAKMKEHRMDHHENGQQRQESTPGTPHS